MSNNISHKVEFEVNEMQSMVHPYQNIMNICNYKTYISRTLHWYIIKLRKCLYETSINNLYNCHRILFKHQELWYPTSVISQYEVSQQEFTIHHFIYYLLAEVVKVYKRKSNRYTNYDILDLIEMNLYNAYQLHMNDLLNKINDYLLPTTNTKALSFVMILSNMFSADLDKNSSWLSTYFIEYSNFTNWSEHDLMYHLILRFEKDIEKCTITYTPYQYATVIDCLYEEIMIYIDEYKEIKLEEFIHFINTYRISISKERLKKYEEELIMKTWHPSRLVNWCFDNEDKNDIGM